MKPSKSRLIADLSGVVRPDATSGTSSGGGTRTPDTRIMIPHAPPLTLEENDDSCGCAAADAAHADIQKTGVARRKTLSAHVADQEQAAVHEEHAVMDPEST